MLRFYKVKMCQKKVVQEIEQKKLSEPANAMMDHVKDDVK